MKPFRDITYLTFLAALRRVCLLGASSSSSSSSEESCFFLFPRWVLGCFLTRGLGTVLKWEKEKWPSPYFIIWCLLQIYITVLPRAGLTIEINQGNVKTWIFLGPVPWDSSSWEICFTRNKTVLLLTPSSHLQETPSTAVTAGPTLTDLTNQGSKTYLGGKEVHKVPKCKSWNCWALAAVYISINIAAGIKSNQQMTKSTREERPSLHGIQQQSISCKEGTWASADSGIYLTQGSWDPSLARMKGGPHWGFSGNNSPLLLRIAWHHNTHSLLLRAALFWAVWKYLPKLLM